MRANTEVTIPVATSKIDNDVIIVLLIISLISLVENNLKHINILDYYWVE